MSVGMSLLAILDEGPAYGLQLRNEFEARTGGVYPLNVGQVYTSLQRLERDGLVEMDEHDGQEAQKVYAITADGRARLREWFHEPMDQKRAPSRDELVLKLVMAANRSPSETDAVIQAERKAVIEQLQGYTKLKRDAPGDADLGWLFLLDSLIFQTEARVRWLDACEARAKMARPAARRSASSPTTTATDAEVHA